MVAPSMFGIVAPSRAEEASRRVHRVGADIVHGPQAAEHSADVSVSAGSLREPGAGSIGQGRSALPRRPFDRLTPDVADRDAKRALEHHHGAGREDGHMGVGDADRKRADHQPGRPRPVPAHVRD